MKALLLESARSAPVVAELSPPRQAEGCVFDVVASALTNLDIATAEGRHYLAADTWPRGVGREAVVRGGDGRRFFLNAVSVPAPWGTWADQVPADPDCMLAVPNEIPSTLAAALGNAGLAGWLSLSWRAALKPGERVLILGATGASGRIATSAAQILGAGSVTVAGRNAAMLERLVERGASASVNLEQADLEEAFRAASDEGFDVVVDFLNGPPAEVALRALRRHGRMIQVGSTLAAGTHLDAQTARRHSLDVRGFAYYHAPIEQQREAYRKLCLAAETGHIEIDYEVISLEDASQAWRSQKNGARTRWVANLQSDRAFINTE